MKKEYLPALSFCFLFTLFFILLKFFPQNVFSANSHVVISEIQIAGITVNDEFIELYNPTNQTEDISGWKIRKKSSDGTTFYTVITLPSQTSIKARSYFLISYTPPTYDGAVYPDATYSSDTILAPNNTIVLTNQTNTIIDKVGFGTAGDFENSPFPTNPPANGSIERKPGGLEEFAGNGEDTDNNANDFITRAISDPQNAGSPPEPPEEAITPTTTPTVTPTVTVTPTEEVPTPTTTVTPTITQTPTPTVSPTISPTVTPTTTPTPQPIETPTLTPTPTISIPEPTPYYIVFGNYLKCQINFRKIENRFFTFFIPYIRCFREKISLENNLLYN